MSEVGRAIKRINHPFVAGWRVLGETPFLSKDTRGREGVVNDVDNSLLRLMVGIGDKVDDLFMFNAKTGARALR